MSKSYSPIRVAVVVPKYGLIGGAEAFVYELTERLAQKQGLEIHVICNRWRPGASPVRFHKAQKIPFPRWLRPLSFAYSVQRIINSHKFDIVHSHERIFECDLMTFHGIPHKNWIKEARAKSLTLFDRATAYAEKKCLSSRRLKRIFPVSSLVKDELKRIYPIDQSRIEIIHPGISLNRFSRSDTTSSRLETRKTLGLSPEDIAVLFVGMNFEIKRLGLIIKGMAKAEALDRRAGRLRLLIVGKGDNGRYMKMAGSLGIEKRLTFLGVIDDVERYFHASDIFAMPSRFDTFGIVVLEAMAAGLPVIISASVGAKDIVEHGQSGFILPKDSTETDMAQALIPLLDQGKRIDMGKRGNRAAKDHDWEDVASRMAEIYRKTASQG